MKARLAYPGDSPFKAARDRPLLHRAIPVSEHLAHYRPSAGRRDLLAGLTVAALALPSGMAYAELAGLPPAAGLYALLLPAVAYALLGSSRQVIVGPEGALSAMVAAAVLASAAAGSGEAAQLGAALGLLAGALFVVARLVRLGWVADYLSRAVLIGYIHGIAVVLIVAQLGKLQELLALGTAKPDCRLQPGDACRSERLAHRGQRRNGGGRGDRPRSVLPHGARGGRRVCSRGCVPGGLLILNSPASGDAAAGSVGDPATEEGRLRPTQTHRSYRLAARSRQSQSAQGGFSRL